MRQYLSLKYVLACAVVGSLFLFDPAYAVVETVVGTSGPCRQPLIATFVTALIVTAMVLIPALSIGIAFVFHRSIQVNRNVIGIPVLLTAIAYAPLPFLLTYLAEHGFHLYWALAVYFLVVSLAQFAFLNRCLRTSGKQIAAKTTLSILGVTLAATIIAYPIILVTLSRIRAVYSIACI